MAPFLYEKIPLTDYHVGNPSTGFSVEPLSVNAEGIHWELARCIMSISFIYLKYY